MDSCFDSPFVIIACEFFCQVIAEKGCEYSDIISHAMIDGLGFGIPFIETCIELPVFGIAFILWEFVWRRQFSANHTLRVVFHLFVSFV